jgi:hypothetical protein
MPFPTEFKSVTAIGDSLISDQLEANLVNFFDWSFLNIGGFFNVQFPGIGTRLRLGADSDYEAGRVWEGYRYGWVWESGVAFQGASPIAISGVYVNGVFRPLASGGYFIDYPAGRIIFDTPLPTNSQVACEFSFRRVRMATADSTWFQELQYHTLELTAENQAEFVQVGSGAWNVLAKNRIQLPAIVVEAVSRVRLRGLEMGARTRIHEQDVLFHVLSDTPMDKKQLHDIVIAQWDHRLVLFDKNQVDDSDAWGLDYEGRPRTDVNGRYPDLVHTFPWKVLAITKMQSEPQDSFPPLYRATCRATVEVDLP